MKVVVSNAQGRVPVAVLHIKGDMNRADSEELLLLDKVKEVIAAGTRDVLLDLSEVPSINSAGLRALHLMHNMLRDQTGLENDQVVSQGLHEGTFKALHFKLLKPTEQVAEALHLTGFDQYLAIFEDMDEAVQAF